MTSLDKEIILFLFDHCQDYLTEAVLKKHSLKKLSNRLILNLFFEQGIRTRNSFSIAASRLGATLLNPDMAQLTTAKGESLLDTIHAFEAMGIDLFIIQHSHNNMASFIAAELHSEASVINAGDGVNQHPSQGLLDLFTIKKHKPDFENIKVAIVGDVLHSRVARSLIEGLKIMGTTDINIIAPPTLAPTPDDIPNIPIHYSLEPGLKEADVIVTLRIQKERMQQALFPDPGKYYRTFGLTTKTLKYAKSDAIVMHPGPLNRGVEIDSAVADGPQSVILEQVQNGVAMKMAIMDSLLNI